MKKLNLLKLRNGLAALPDDYHHFGMSYYYVDLSKRYENQPPEAGTVAPSACGSVACALGHAPSMVEPPIALENWRGYCLRVFGIIEGSIAWDWLFSARWADYDNTPAGVVSRIDYYLNNATPKEFVGNDRYKNSLAVYQWDHDK